MINWWYSEQRCFWLLSKHCKNQPSTTSLSGFFLCFLDWAQRIAKGWQIANIPTQSIDIYMENDGGFSLSYFHPFRSHHPWCRHCSHLSSKPQKTERGPVRGITSPVTRSCPNDGGNLWSVRSTRKTPWWKLGDPIFLPFFAGCSRFMNLPISCPILLVARMISQFCNTHT